MRLEQFYLDGFGHFHRQKIGPLNSHITVLYGPNEAGKSTLLAFVRTILFGFPQRGRTRHYPPLAGGRHGGHIRLRDDAGTAFMLERYTGTRGGPFVLHSAAGPEPQDFAGLQRLTGHASADLFRNVFAFSLDEIQSEGLMNNAEVSDRIYSAGIGAFRLPEFTESLSKRRDALFRPRGSAQTIAKLLRDLTDTDKQLRTVQGNADQYLRLAHRQEAITRELDQADAALSALHERRGEVQRLQEGWNDWQDLQDCEARLQDLPALVRLPENPIERLENLEERLQQAREDCADAAEQLRQTRETALAPIPGENLLHDADRIEDIRRARSSFDNSVHDLPERQGELRKMEEALAERLRELGAPWNEDNLDAIDTSLTVRNEIETWEQQLQAARQAADDSRIRLEQDRDQLHRLQAEVEAAQQPLQAEAYRVADITLRPPRGDWAALLEDRALLEGMRRGRQSFGDSVRDLPERQAELKAQESELNTKLRDFGPGWDEARLERFDTSRMFRHEVARWKERMGACTEDMRQARHKVELAASHCSESAEAVRTAEARRPVKEPHLDATRLHRQREALRRTRSRLDEFERARINVTNLQGQIRFSAGEQVLEDPAAQWPVILGLAGIGLILISLFLPTGAQEAGIVTGLALLAVAGYRLLRNQTAASAPSGFMRDGLAQNLRTAEAAETETRGKLVAAAKPLDLSVFPEADVLDDAESRLDTAVSRLALWTEADERWREAQRGLQIQTRHVATAEEQMQAATVAARQCRQEWEGWLRSLGLEGSFGPETAMEFVGAIETARTVLAQVRQMRHRVRAIEVDIEEYQALVQPLMRKYGIAWDARNHARTMAVADVFIEQFEQVGQRVMQRDDVMRRRQQQSLQFDDATRKQHQTAAALAAVQSDWQAWLRQRGLPDSFRPNLMSEFLARVEAVRTARAEVRRMRDRVAAIEHDIHEFREQVTQLAADHDGPPVFPETRHLAAVADQLIHRFTQVQVQVSDRERASRQQAQQQTQLDQRQRRRENLQEKLAALLAGGDTDDVEEFRRRVRQQQERLTQEQRRRDLLGALRRLSGPHPEFEVFRTTLATSDRTALEQESRALTEQLEHMEHQCNALREERGRNENALEQLTGEEESSALRIRRHTLLEQLQSCAREWSRLTLAATLLNRTRQKFERERQPSVIRHAKRFFADVTGQRYTGLFAPIGEHSITVTDANGSSKKPSALSRGTREQLYLALRFGLILEFGEHAERLPVVVDEALVNFDPERARLAAAALARLAVTNQVLIFTCHRNIANMFAAHGALVLDIRPGGSPP